MQLRILLSVSESDIHSSISITVIANTSRACTNFLEMIIDDDITGEEDEAFTIVVGSSVAMVIIVDDDGMPMILYYNYNYGYYLT